VLDEELDDLLGRNFHGDRKREDPADRGARYQIEMARNRPADLGLQVGKHLGGVQAAKASARKRQDLKACAHRRTRRGGRTRHVGRAHAAPPPKRVATHGPWRPIEEGRRRG